MARRTITDEEIALIKAMVARGMKNRDVQFFFNRPGRAVNSGRITDIAINRYSNSAEIAQASDEELLADGGWRVTAGETDQAECKASFGLKHPAAWLRAIAALANNRGGYIFFGVRDEDATGAHQVVGLDRDEFADTDPAELVKRIRSTFDPTPRFQRTVIEVGAKKVGVLYVEPHPSRPVIATKNEGSGEIREGDIFFRYPGQSTRINYADLRAMLDARDAQARADIMPMIERLLALGPARAMVADLAEGRLVGGKRVVELDEDIIKRLNLINGSTS
jgi:hypothetical protein